jgi:hypothetical protein
MINNLPIKSRTFNIPKGIIRGRMYVENVLVGLLIKQDSQIIKYYFEK